MSSVNFIDLNINSAQQFLESVSETSADNVYFTFGKVDGWANDAAPPSANTQFVTYNEVWKNMIGAKRLTGNDVRLVFRRNDWAANTVYIEYDQENPNLFLDNSNMIVVTSDWNVYKCIFNANNANSTVEPTAVNPNTITSTADGYIWKYMFSISDVGQLRFTTSEYVPVRTLTADNESLQWDVQEAATEGAIYAIKITNGGSNYSNASNIVITISGDGTGATATAGINNISNTVNTISVTDYGSDYTTATIAISGGAGTGATARALLSPQDGHGSNPAYEVGAKNVLINPRLRNTESGVLSVDNDFRQIALIKNPLVYDGSTSASNTVISQTMDLTLTGSGVNYVEDEIVYQGASQAAATFSARVQSFDSANSLLRVINTTGTPTNEGLIGANSTATKFISSVTNPGMSRFTGRLLYVDNIEPISRDLSQTEDFKIVLSF